MKEIIGVRFKRPGKIYFFDPKHNRIHKGQYVIVETSMGESSHIASITVLLGITISSLVILTYDNCILISVQKSGQLRPHHHIIMLFLVQCFKNELKY